MISVEQYRTYVGNLKRTLDALPLELIEATVEQIHLARVNQRQVFIMGNGGSAATASHFACDLGKNTVMAGFPRLRVQSLNDNMAFFSACANDYGYDTVFAEQLTNFIQPEDVVLAISASGNSANVLKAVQVARAGGAFTIGWSGYQGGKLAKMVDLPIVIPSDSIEQIEDIHLMMAHMVTVSVRQAAQNGFLLNHNQAFPAVMTDPVVVAR
ncbi:MAG: D-sedoheptulose-7-phosphate isomerase [Caldilineaceae bacterium]